MALFLGSSGNFGYTIDDDRCASAPPQVATESTENPTTPLFYVFVPLVSQASLCNLIHRACQRWSKAIGVVWGGILTHGDAGVRGFCGFFSRLLKKCLHYATVRALINAR